MCESYKMDGWRFRRVAQHTEKFSDKGEEFIGGCSCEKIQV